MKEENREKEKLCFMDTNSFIVHMKTEGMFVDIAKGITTKFDTSNY